MGTDYADKALLMEQYKEWVASTPNPESLPMTDVLLLAVLRELQKQTSSVARLASKATDKPKPPHFAY